MNQSNFLQTPQQRRKSISKAGSSIMGMQQTSISPIHQRRGPARQSPNAPAFRNLQQQLYENDSMQNTSQYMEGSIQKTTSYRDKSMRDTSPKISIIERQQTNNSTFMQSFFSNNQSNLSKNFRTTKNSTMTATIQPGAVLPSQIMRKSENIEQMNDIQQKALIKANLKIKQQQEQKKLEKLFKSETKVVRQLEDMVEQKKSQKDMSELNVYNQNSLIQLRKSIYQNRRKRQMSHDRPHQKNNSDYGGMDLMSTLTDQQNMMRKKSQHIPDRKTDNIVNQTFNQSMIKLNNMKFNESSTKMTQMTDTQQDFSKQSDLNSIKKGGDFKTAFDQIDQRNMSFYNRGSQMTQQLNVDEIAKEVDSILGTPDVIKQQKIRAYEQSMDTFGREEDDDDSSNNDDKQSKNKKQKVKTNNNDHKGSEFQKQFEQYLNQSKKDEKAVMSQIFFQKMEKQKTDDEKKKQLQDLILKKLQNKFYQKQQ